jgi:hypothetical protein
VSRVVVAFDRAHECGEWGNIPWADGAEMYVSESYFTTIRAMPCHAPLSDDPTCTQSNSRS